MRRTIITAALILTLTATAGAQDLAHKVELSTGIGFTLVSKRMYGYGASAPFISFPLRVGYYITNGIEVEAEEVLSLYDSGSDWFPVDAGLTTSLNASYNFSVGRYGRFRPFLLTGIGHYSQRAHDRLNRLAINFGAGFKALTGRHTAFRLECRLQSPTRSNPIAPSIQMGVSFLL